MVPSSARARRAYHWSSCNWRMRRAAWVEHPVEIPSSGCDHLVVNAPRQPTILHVDLDAFFAAVEQRDHPELRGKPVIVGGGGPNDRGVVSTASYEARAFGVHSAMPLREAGRRCPQGVFVPVDGRKYSKVSKEVMAILGRFSPLVEQLSID